jgi:hypothetical protein
LLSKLFSTSATIDTRIGELAARRSELQAEADAADTKVAVEIVESGTSRSAKIADALLREAASLDRAIAALEAERSVVADREEQVRLEKAWRAADDFGRHLGNRGPAIEALITQLRVTIEAVLADAAKLRDLTPRLPEGYEFNTLLTGGLLSVIQGQLHGEAFRSRNPGVSVAALINKYVGLCLRERPDTLRSGTQFVAEEPPIARRDGLKG